MTANKYKVELSLIKEDTLFFRDLICKMIGNRSIGVLTLGLQPYISLFVVESFRYFAKRAPSATCLIELNYSDIIQRSRHGTKLLNDKKYGLEGIINLHKELPEDHYKYFIEKHVGILEPFKRIFRKDLGLFFYDNRLICTTHAAQINLGYGEYSLTNVIDDNNSLSWEIGYTMGQYIGSIADIIWDGKPPDDSNYIKYQLIDDHFDTKDVLSSTYYQSILGNQDGDEIVASIVYILSPIIFLDKILSNLVVNSPETYFKLKLITLYHFVNSIRGLQEICQSIKIQSDKIENLFDQILSNLDLKYIAKLKSLRNILVHYGFGNFPEDLIKEDLRMSGLVEYYFNDSSYLSVDKMLDRQISKVSNLANDWLLRH